MPRIDFGLYLVLNRAMTNEPKNTSFVLYTAQSGDVKLEVFLEDETLWLNQKMMADLFGVEINTINYHLSEVFKSCELTESSVIRKNRITASDGKKYITKFYNLDAIISVGYRVNSQRATQFRIWATQVLREYVVKGFVVDDERLKQGERAFGKDYFDELLERVRSIRASERRVYLKITDIFAECSVDYDPKSKTTIDFFSTVQNLFHYAISGQTAAEIINAKADRNLPNMGLTTWKNAPTGRILATDVTVAKNFLELKQIKKLERTIFGFFDYIENLIENRKSFTMAEFVESVMKFLTFNEYKILTGKGNVSKEMAEKKALDEYKEFNRTQQIFSDFEKAIKQISKD